MLAVTLARWLAPLVWWGTRRSARRLLVFAQAERASMIDLRVAARLTASPVRAAAYLRHADDEARHATMFVRRAAELLRASGDSAPTDVHADCESLFARLGELDFLAFVHHGEARGRRQFENHARWLAARGRTRDAALFEALVGDELRHEHYTGALLRELAGDERSARAALGRVRRWELGRGWLRVGRALGSRVYVVLATLLYLCVLPLSLLVRIARPIRRGFVPLAEPTRARAAIVATEVQPR
jgi:hypothetical protein